MASALPTFVVETARTDALGVAAWVITVDYAQVREALGAYICGLRTPVESVQDGSA